MILYGATNFQELKAKCDAYEKFKQSERSNDKKYLKHENKKSATKKEKSSSSGVRCDLCGDLHLAENCPNKNKKGVKCFKCNH